MGNRIVGTNEIFGPFLNELLRYHKNNWIIKFLLPWLRHFPFPGLNGSFNKMIEADEKWIKEPQTSNLTRLFTLIYFRKF